MPTFKAPLWILLAAFAACVVVYAAGLNGPFMFDDYVHITQNKWVKIESLAWPDLVRAWNSSFSPFPTNRPLAQLTFGINHAVAGLDPWVFKATNLVIHLVTGVLVFVFTRLLYRAATGSAGDPGRGNLLAAATAAVWLLHPLHVSTVLYTVQRMAQLSSLGLLAALCCYFAGRIRIAEGRSGTLLILASAPIALLAFLAKETAALLPLLLLVSEITVLRTVPVGEKRGFLRAIWLVFIALPLVVSLAYFAVHPGYFNYDARTFTLEERVLTQARVLWLYLQWLYVPDITAYGLFHDDIPLSTSLTDPSSTLAAVVGLLGLVTAALVWRKKAPIFAFAVLFFLAGHALESSVFPLEVVFEHRNYLPSLGPLLLLAYLVTVASTRFKVGRAAGVLGTLLLTSYAAANYLRVENWSSYNSFILSSAEHHPNSPRSNFMAGQLAITAISQSQGDVSDLVQSGRTFLHKGLAVDPRCINCLFGLIVLDLHVNRRPDEAVVQQLRNALRSGHVDPTKVSVSQFSYLVKWMKSGASSLSSSDLESIFDAALENPQWNNTGRAGIEAAYREYHEFVSQDLESAVSHARRAVDAWPDQWSYHIQLVRVLQKLGRTGAAQKALENAARVASNESQLEETASMSASLAEEKLR